MKPCTVWLSEEDAVVLYLCGTFEYTCSIAREVRLLDPVSLTFGVNLCSSPSVATFWLCTLGKRLNFSELVSLF